MDEGRTYFPNIKMIKTEDLTVHYTELFYVHH